MDMRELKRAVAERGFARAFLTESEQEHLSRLEAENERLRAALIEARQVVRDYCNDMPVRNHTVALIQRALEPSEALDMSGYADLRQEYEAQHRALVEAQRAWVATGELRDKAEAENERLRAARLVELETIANEARRYASFYPQGSDGRNTFVMLAEWVEARAHNATLAEV